MEQKNSMRSFENIAKLIKKSRMNHTKGYSQSELSNLLGYKNGQFISNVERALCNIPFKMLTKVCSILDVSEKSLKEAILRDCEETLDNYLGSDSKALNSIVTSSADKASISSLGIG